jgi:broad specificity phosphatase PhoE
MNMATPEFRNTRWWWVRHAPVREDNGCIYGQADLSCDCSDTVVFDGLARALPQNAVWVASNLRRTHQTAAAIWAAGFPKPDHMPHEPELAEQHLGDWQGMNRAAFHASRPRQVGSHWFGPPDQRAPGGESFVDLCQRVHRCIDRLNVAHAGKDIVAVAHGGTIKAAITHALGLGPAGGLPFAIENCSVTRLDHVTLGEQSSWWIGMVNHQPWLVPSQHPTMHQPAGPEIAKLA